VAVILVFLIAITIWWLRSDPTVPNPSSKNAETSSNGTTSSQSLASGETDRPSQRVRRPDLPKAEGEVIASSAVHTRIPLGHSMVTGGYVTKDGHHEFVVVTPTWLETPSGEKQIMVKSTVLNVDQEALVSTGLKSLVTGEQKSLQNAEVWTPEDVTRTMSDTKGLNLLSSPSVVITPGSSAQVRIGNGKASFMLDLEASEAPDGGFELKSEIKRVE
jgi:hypothetical protein